MPSDVAVTVLRPSVVPLVRSKGSSFARMEVALSGPQTLSEPLRRRASLPLSQLVEATQSRGNIPNHLLESKIYANLKSNSLIQAEPSELHFSGFELAGSLILMVVKTLYRYD
uniref:Uncharacterized protein n=1 Tax=Astatotilapia calliptera TaxID=8154 RepID=A0AAX7VSI7_ASTCA